MSIVHNNPATPPEKLMTMTSLWPFTNWEMDLIGALPIGKGSMKYAMVIVDYFTKWIDARPLKSIAAKKIVKFCYKNIVCLWNSPQDLTKQWSTVGLSRV